jgi:hypothetical protein
MYVTTDMFKVNIPEGRSGDWKIERYSLTEDEARFASMRGRSIRAGTYTGLFNRNAIWMSDTPGEIRDHIGFCQDAHGRVLITGLGLGMAIAVLLRKPNVTHVTVIEKSEDVIRLVAEHLPEQSKLNVIHADAFEYSPSKEDRFDFAWQDIWQHICVDNLEEITRLKRKWCRRVGSQSAWVEGTLRRQAKHSRLRNY